MTLVESEDTVGSEPRREKHDGEIGEPNVKVRILLVVGQQSVVLL